MIKHKVSETCVLEFVNVEHAQLYADSIKKYLTFCYDHGYTEKHQEALTHLASLNKTIEEQK